MCKGTLYEYTSSGEFELVQQLEKITQEKLVISSGSIWSLHVGLDVTRLDHPSCYLFVPDDTDLDVLSFSEEGKVNEALGRLVARLKRERVS